MNSDAEQPSETWDDVIYELDQAAWRKEIRFDVALVPEDEPVFNQGSVCAKVLGPSRYLAAKGPGGGDRKGRKITTNSISAVVGLVVAGMQMVLLPGDIDEIGLDELLTHNGTINTNILVFPHHGESPEQRTLPDTLGSFAMQSTHSGCLLNRERTLWYTGP